MRLLPVLVLTSAVGLASCGGSDSRTSSEGAAPKQKIDPLAAQYTSTAQLVLQSYCDTGPASEDDLTTQREKITGYARKYGNEAVVDDEGTTMRDALLDISASLTECEPAESARFKNAADR